MKLRAPIGCTSVSYGGRVFTVDADGLLEVAEDVAAALAAHGFSLWPADAPPRWNPRAVTTAGPDGEKVAASDIESLNRLALFALLREKGVHVALPISNAELRAAARRAMAGENAG